MLSNIVRVCVCVCVCVCVAERIERLPRSREVVGSIPGRTKPKV